LTQPQGLNEYRWFLLQKNRLRNCLFIHFANA
jgi:hypothetical protein